MPQTTATSSSPWRIPKSARTPEEVLAMCGLTAQDIQKNVMGMLGVG